MRIGQRIDQALARIEWRWSLLNLVYGLGFFGSFALPAWSVSAMDIFQQYAPLSWVSAGFLGVLVLSLILFLISVTRRQWHRASYDHLFRKAHPAINPLDSTFSNARIFLNEFALPSDPNIVGKNFIDCEIIGPANIFLHDGNSVPSLHGPLMDAVRLDPGAQFYNGYSFTGCVFRGCSFHKVTLFVRYDEFDVFRNWTALNWVSQGTVAEPTLPFAEAPIQPNERISHQTHQDTATEAPG